MIVEGVSYDINWRAFKRGTSIFFPCLRPATARKEILATTNRLKMKVDTRVVIEEGIRGLRVWRI